MRIAAYAVVIALLLASSPSYAAKATYTGSLRIATHRGQTYDANTWDAKVIWYATFFNDEFRRVFAEKYAKVNHMGPLEASQWMEDQEYTQEKEWTFFISMYTKKDYKKLSLEPDTFWEVLMITDSGETVWPTEIEQVPVTPLVRVLYPHINRWSKLYVVKYPKTALGKSVSLMLRSVVGQTELTWALK